MKHCDRLITHKVQVAAPRDGAGASSRRTGRRLLMASVIAALTAVGLGLAIPAISAAALVDGRVYEQVSPANKNGNVVGNPANVETGSFGLASEAGDAVIFVGTGAMGGSYGGMIGEFVARRSTSGWQTSSAVPRQQGEIFLLGAPLTLVPSLDFSRMLFGAFSPYTRQQPLNEASAVNIYLSEDPAVEPTWIGRPSISDPLPLPGRNQRFHDYLVAGGTPSLNTVYFSYSGTLIPQDASRTPNVGGGQDGSRTDASGFYEWANGGLTAAGVLPNGTLDPFGAVPAAIAGGSIFERDFNAEYQAQALDNEVSANGSRAFFVSPDPVASTVVNPEGCEKFGPCTNAPPQLYAREDTATGAKRTILVSRSQLPGEEGAPAPHGVVKVPNAPSFNAHNVGSTYVYASSDGSQVFFKSTDRLTSAAPNDLSVKQYDFDVNSETVTYLPGVTGTIVTASHDGSDFIFETAPAAPATLNLWTTGPSGGRITQIAPLPQPPNVGEPFYGHLDVSAGRASADGSVFVFRTNAPVPGGFNNGGGFAQIYRYDVPRSSLVCVTCSPPGVSPSGNAQVSYNNTDIGRLNGFNAEPMTTVDTRVMSSDGSRVFFDTPSALTPQATNGKRDIYEWENGNVYLLSSGKSTENSYILDSSASGNDVFFATAAALVPGDVDDAYDLYDARVPQPGDKPPPPPAPCQSTGCEATTESSVLPSAPPSAVFNGSGNLAPPPQGRVVTLTQAGRLASALHACRKKGRRRRHRCELQARRRYRASSARARPNGRVQ
jgi:hypothetical protein